MSHFSVLVFTKGKPTNDQLSEIMMPWHEFECTGYDNQYVRDMDITEEAKAEYEKATERVYVDPQGEAHNAYSDRFYRDPTTEETKKIGRIAGTGCGHGMSWSSKDWGDGKGYRTKVHFCPDGWTEKDQQESRNFAEWVKGWYGKTIVRRGNGGKLTVVDGDYDTDEENERQLKYGYCLVNDAGDVEKVIKRTNPDAKWDWWVIGGRYSGKFSARKPEDIEENYETCFICQGSGMRRDAMGIQCRMANPNYTCNGCDGKGKSLKHAPQWVQEGNQMDAAQIDFDAMKAKAVNERQEWIDEAVKKTGCSFDEIEAGLITLKKLHAIWVNIPTNKRPYGKDYHDWLKTQENGNLASQVKSGFDWDLPEVPEGMRLMDWIKAAPAITAFAVVKDGKWYERGRMGWWAVVHDEKEKDAWEREVNKLVSVFEADTWITVVECHI